MVVGLFASSCAQDLFSCTPQVEGDTKRVALDDDDDDGDEDGGDDSDR